MPVSAALDRPMASAPLAFKLEALNSKLPFKLTPTNLAGAFTPPPLPDHFDPHTASAKDLMKNGLMLRRPVAGQDPPELVAAWNRVFSRKWLAKDFIAPQLAPQLGRAHKMRGGRESFEHQLQRYRLGRRRHCRKLDFRLRLVDDPDRQQTHRASGNGRRLEFRLVGRNRRRQYQRREVLQQ